jgi:hypothetical protein
VARDEQLKKNSAWSTAAGSAKFKGLVLTFTNDEKRAHLTDLKREHLIDQVCVEEILPPEKA